MKKKREGENRVVGNVKRQRQKSEGNKEKKIVLSILLFVSSIKFLTKNYNYSL